MTAVYATRQKGFDMIRLKEVRFTLRFLSRGALAFMALLAVRIEAKEIDLRSPNPEAVAEVLAGTRHEASAAWWGFDPEDSTAAFQAAIRSGARRVIVPRMSTPWIVDRIQLESNQEIFFEPGVEVVAKKGAFRGKTDCLFEARNKTNIRLIGYGATLRMHRSDYAAPPYEKAEWRHVLSLRGCTNVVVEGLTLAESGGDGIYLGAGAKGEPNCDIIIRNVVCDRNYRQGISVITAKNLLIENVVLRGTGGTPPSAGIDFEPNLPHELLVNCVMRDCVIEDNAGLGILLYLNNLNARSEPVSIRFENCVTRGTNARSFQINTGNSADGAVRGVVELVNCRFEDTGRAGIAVRSKPVTGLDLKIVNCVIADPAEKCELAAPIVFASGPEDVEPVGGVILEELLVVEKTARRPIAMADLGLVGIRDVNGTIRIRTPEKEELVRLGADLLEEWFPTVPIARLPVVPLTGEFAERVLGEKKWTDGQLPQHWLRFDATYAVWISEPGELRATVSAEAVGANLGREIPVELFDARGTRLARGIIKVGSVDELVYRINAKGLYFLRLSPGSATVRLVRSSHPVGIASLRDQIRFFRTAGRFTVFVPANHTAGLGAAGYGDAERVAIEIHSSDGKLLWQENDVSDFAAIALAPCDDDQYLRLTLGRPARGVLEDVTLRIRGIPPLLLFDLEQ